MRMVPNEVSVEDLPVWDIDQYLYEEADDGFVVTIYAKDMFQDNPTNKYFQLTCHKATYDRLLTAMGYASRMDIEEPCGLEYGNNGIFTQVQIYDDNGDSECIVVGEIRLPNGQTTITNGEEISALAEFIERIKENA